MGHLLANIGLNLLGDKMGDAVYPCSPTALLSFTYIKVGGGDEGIRTLETIPRLHTFQACAFDHSATSPPTGLTICFDEDKVSN